MRRSASGCATTSPANSLLTWASNTSAHSAGHAISCATKAKRPAAGAFWPASACGSEGRRTMLATTMIAALLALQAAPGHHPSKAGPTAPQTAPLCADESAVRAVLARYKSAIERLDASGTEALFTEDSAVFETGGGEGTYKEYLAHPLGPGLAAVRSVAVRMEGDLALATETYNYRIETKSGEIAMRKGVATSVLIRTADGWKILVMHNSAQIGRAH